MKNKYNITLTENQLQIIRKALNLKSRIMIGQVEGDLLNLFVESLRYRTKDKGFPREDSDKILHHLSKIKKIVWDKDSHQSFGVGYSAEIDSMIDMIEVIRHEIWKVKPDAPKYIVSAYPPMHWNKGVPLIEVELKL